MIRPDFNHYPTLMDMVRSGEGVAIGSVGLDDSLVKSGEIQRLTPTLSRPGYGYYLTHAPRALDRSQVRAVRDYLAGHTRREDKNTG